MKNPPLHKRAANPGSRKKHMSFLSIISILAIVYLLVCGGVYLYQERLIFFPEVLPSDYSFLIPHPFRELSLQPSPEVHLHALQITTPNPKAVVVYFHGNAGSLRTWHAVADDFVTRNMDIVIPDYRGYGKSRGPLSQAALLQDAVEIYKAVQQRYPDTPIILYGRSLGSGIAAWLATQVRPAMLILETPYDNFAKLAQQYMPFLPTSLLLKYTFPTDQWLSEVKCPIHLVHGTADRVIPYESSQRLMRLSLPNSYLTTISGGGHNNLPTFPAYQSWLDTLLHSPLTID